MRMKRPAVVITAAALMGAAACGGGGGGGPEAGPGTGPDDTQSPQGISNPGGNVGGAIDDDAPAPAPEMEGATEGGTLTVLTSVAPTTFDPTRAYYVDSTAILSALVTRSLTQYIWRDEDGDGNGEMILVPDMATNTGVPNDDNTEWTFTLREGLKYEDGSPVKCDDVAYAVKRSFAIAELPDGPTYQTTFFKDGATYKGPYKDGANYNGVECNGQDLTIFMRRPFSDMPYYGSFPAFTAIPEEKDTNPTAYGRHPMATGPYMFDEYRPGSLLTLKKNPHWDPATDPGRHQYVDGWTFKFGQDSAQIDNVIINDQGDAQTTLTYDNIIAADYPTAQAEGALDRLVTGTSPCTYMWYLDMRKITDIDVRRAIGWAFPYKAVWKAGGEIIGLTRIPGTTILPPGTPGRKVYESLPGNDGSETDPAKAKALLEKAGEMGYEIKFLYATNDPLSVQAKNAIVEGLKAGGFTPKPIASTVETIRDDRTKYDSPINVRSSGWCSDWPTGGSWFPAQWYGDLVGLEGMPNPANFKVPEVDKQIDNILDNMTLKQATEAWGELDELIETKYYPAVILGYSGTAFLHGSKVGGMENDEVRGMPTLNQMFITE